MTNLSEVEPNEVIDFLKKNLQFREVYQHILYQKIINQKATELNLQVKLEEIQQEAESQRRQQRLEKAADTYVWLSEQMITPEDWEVGIREKLLRQKLAEFLFSKRVDEFFQQNKLNFDQVILYQIIVPYEKLALEIFYQIEEEEMSFYQAAYLYNTEEDRRYKCGYEGKLFRWNINPDMAAAIFAAEPQTVIHPIKTEQGCHILMVEAFLPAQLTPEIYQEILHKMFEEWLMSELNHLLHYVRG